MAKKRSAVTTVEDAFRVEVAGAMARVLVQDESSVRVWVADVNEGTVQKLVGIAWEGLAPWPYAQYRGTRNFRVTESLEGPGLFNVDFEARVPRAM